MEPSASPPETPRAPRRRAVIVLPCKADDAQVQGFYNEIVRNCGETKVAAVSYFSDVPEQTTIALLLHENRWRLLKEVHFTSETVAVRLSNRWARPVLIEWEESKSQTGTRLHGLAKGWRTGWLLFGNPIFLWFLLLLLFAGVWWAGKLADERRYDAALAEWVSKAPEREAHEANLRREWGDEKYERVVEAAQADAVAQRSRQESNNFATVVLMALGGVAAWWLCWITWRRVVHPIFPSFYFDFPSVRASYWAPKVAKTIALVIAGANAWLLVRAFLP